MTDPVISKPIPLQEPIKRGDGEAATVIESVQIRRPTAGELRGVKLGALMTTDVSSLISVLPRVTMPSLLETEVAKMNPVDFIALGDALTDFFYSPAQKAAMVATLTTSSPT